MKITIGELFNAKIPIERLIQCKVPVKAGFAIAKLTEAINKELVISGKMHDDLVMEYGEETPAGSKNYAVLPTNPNYGLFHQKLDELKAITVEMNVNPIILPEVLEIEPAVLMALEKFIKTN